MRAMNTDQLKMEYTAKCPKEKAVLEMLCIEGVDHPCPLKLLDPVLFQLNSLFSYLLGVKLITCQCRRGNRFSYSAPHPLDLDDMQFIFVILRQKLNWPRAHHTPDPVVH